MNKLNQLRKLLLDDSGLDLQQDQVNIFAEAGSVQSHYDSSNNHFKLRYVANIIITDYTGNVEHVVYVLAQWLKQHQPNHDNEPISFKAEILNDNAVDISLNMDLTETVKAEVEGDNVRLFHPPEPTLDEFCDPVDIVVIPQLHKSS